MKDEEQEKHPRVMGEPVEAAPAKPSAQAGALIPSQGIPVAPMGSRIPTAASPLAMQSMFNAPRVEAQPQPAAPPAQAHAVAVEARPSVVARPVAPVLGERAGRRMGQPATAPVTAADAADLIGYLDDAVSTLSRRPSSDPGCGTAVMRATAVRDRLRDFASSAREGDTYPMGQDELAALDKTFSCALLAKQAEESSGLSGAGIGQAAGGPNTGAYVVLGAAIVGMVVALNI